MSGIHHFYAQESVENRERSNSNIKSAQSDLLFTQKQVIGKDSPVDYVSTNIWDQICRRVFPLFNGEGIKGNIEDLNELVSQYLGQQLYGTIIEEVKDLLQHGMQMMNTKLSTVPDERILNATVETWRFFFGTVLPYFQGVFLPLQLEIKGSTLVSNVRTLALIAFREQIILPIVPKLKAGFPGMFKEINRGIPLQIETAGRLLQMMLILNDVTEEKNAAFDEALLSLKGRTYSKGRVPLKNVKPEEEIRKTQI
ncbi:HbrB-like-domain-containing protein [Paraphysoderma sedebokerense]|nr:HbrB-like-domain-containing protein [Paraphysoderma sedebokerense]